MDLGPPVQGVTTYTNPISQLDPKIAVPWRVRNRDCRDAGHGFPWARKQRSAIHPEFVSHYVVLYNSWRRNLYCPRSLQVIKFKHKKPGGNNMVAFNPEFPSIWDQGENRCCKVLPPPGCRSHVISQFHFVSRILPFCKTRLQFLGSLHAEAYSRRWVQVWTRSNVIAINHHPEYLDLFLAS